MHAGVVGWRGRAILIPGRSGTGKTSLVAALVEQGAVYYSDDYAPIDADGRVRSYARAPSVRRPASSTRSRRAAGERAGAAALADLAGRGHRLPGG